MANPVVHFEIAGVDGARTREFYGGLFDWQFQEIPEMSYTMVAQQEGGIGGGIMQAPHGHPFAAFYVQVDDLAETLAKAESLGGKTAVPPTDIPNIGAFAFLADPDGNLIGLFKSL